MIGSKKRQFICLFIFAISLLIANQTTTVRAAPTATLGVGPGLLCTHSSLQAAINDANDFDTIRIGQSNINFLRYTVSNKSLTIVGGYDSDCWQPQGTRTTLNGQPIIGTGNSVITASTTSLKTLALQNLNLINGKDTSNGGGLDIVGNYVVTLDNVHIYNNIADNGGGISVDDGAVVLKQWKRRLQQWFERRRRGHLLQRWFSYIGQQQCRRPRQQQ